MRYFWIVAVWLMTAAFVFPGPVNATERGGQLLPVAEKTALDQLFDKLKNAADESEARKIANQIWRVWFLHPNGAIQHLMTRAQAARRAGLRKEALAELDKIVQLAPDYSEGWNQRATILFMLGRDAESIADIQQVLRLEPRHFGALAGLGLIHMRAENWKSAIASFERALKIHPFLQEKTFIDMLKKKMKGRAL